MNIPIFISTGNHHDRQQQYKNYDFVLGRKTDLSNIQSQVGSSRSSFVNSIAKRISYYDNQIFLKCAKLKTILRFKDSCIAEFADLDYGIDWNKKVSDFVDKFEKKTLAILEQNESTNLDEAFTFRRFLIIKEFFHLLIENGLFRLYIIHLVAEKKSNSDRELAFERLEEEERDPFLQRDYLADAKMMIEISKTKNRKKRK